MLCAANKVGMEGVGTCSWRWQCYGAQSHLCSANSDLHVQPVSGLQATSLLAVGCRLAPSPTHVEPLITATTTHTTGGNGRYFGTISATNTQLCSKSLDLHNNITIG